MGMFDNLKILKNAMDIVREDRSLAEMNKTLDQAVRDGDLPDDNDGITELKGYGGRYARKSRLQYRTSTRDGLWLSNMYQIIRDVAAAHDKSPSYGSPSRDDYLAKFWKSEPILAGAVYSMSAKMGALSWSITGNADDARVYATMLSQAAYSFDGYDWGGFISSTAEDFYTLDRGVWWESARNGSSLHGRLAALGHIDGLACWPTGNIKTPVWYQSNETGQSIKFKPGQYIHFASMPSPREEYYGLGFCAVSRAMRAAKLLTGLRDYDEEKLANLPPEGVAAVSGLTMTEFKNALKLWQAERKRNSSLTFPQVLWLIGSQPNAKVGLDMIGFSQLPESFDRGDVVTQYINTLALDFGVDVREFWPVSSSSLGTASESEIQHMKAKGKGPGEFISITERSLNAEFPDTIHFEFDTQDIGEDKVAAEVAKMWIDAYLPLTKAGAMMSSPGGALASGSTTVPDDRGNAAAQQKVGLGGGEGIISDEHFLRLLSDKGVLPDYIVGDDRVAIMDYEVYIRKEGPVAKYTWKDGVLTMKQLPSINLPTPSNVLDAGILKGGPGSGHHGHGGLDGVWGGSTPGPDKGGGEGGTAKKPYKVPIRLQNRRVADAILSELGASRSSRDADMYDAYDEHGIKGGYYEVGIRYWGRWDNPPDARYEQDYDWQVMADSSKAEMNKKVEGYSKKYSDYDIEWTTGEKNWLYITVTPKKTNKEYKEELERNIRGKPIPESEVTRGASVTETAIVTEQELWRGIHALSQHAPTKDEEEEEVADEATAD